LLLGLSLVATVYALFVQANVAAAVFACVSAFFAVMLWLLPPRWNRFVLDVIANFGW
jgi:hypothetical protein